MRASLLKRKASILYGDDSADEDNEAVGFGVGGFDQLEIKQETDEVEGDGADFSSDFFNIESYSEVEK